MTEEPLTVPKSRRPGLHRLCPPLCFITVHPPAGRPFSTQLRDRDSLMKNCCWFGMTLKKTGEQADTEKVSVLQYYCSISGYFHLFLTSSPSETASPDSSSTDAPGTGGQRSLKVRGHWRSQTSITILTKLIQRQCDDEQIIYWHKMWFIVKFLFSVSNLQLQTK